MLAVVLSTSLLAACSGGGGSEDGSSTGIPTVDASAGSTTAVTVGISDAGQTSGSTAGATDENSAGSSDNGTASTTGGSTVGTTSGDTAGATDGTPDPTPIVRAPPDAQILLSDTLALDGAVTFNGMPLDIPVINWAKISGPGDVSFTNSLSAKSSVGFDAVGVYQLQLSAANGSYSASDTMQVIVTSSLVNQAPVVDAGPDETLIIDEVLNLSAQVSDDGLPTGTLFGQWSKESGPGEVTFGEPSAYDTIATFSAVGNYELLLSVSDGVLDKADSIKVTVENASSNNNSGGNVNAANAWQNVTSSNGSKPQARHEAGAVAYQNQFYLMGGRGKRQVNRYSPSKNRWENLGTPDLELSHFQPVAFGGKIYVLGSLDCCFPSESVIASIQIFNPANKTWSKGATLPKNRRRGSAGVVVHNNKIYMVGGSTNGHDGGMVNWFDEYNPANNKWKTLPNAPNQRDHFTAAMVGSKLVVAGGRKTDHPRTFSNLVAEVDIYNFGTGKWQNGASIPTKRAGAMTVSYGDEIIVIGGESDSGRPALSTVEAYNVKTNKWRSLKSLKTARHSGGAAIIDGAIHVVGGNTTTGGGNESQAHEKLKLK